MGEICGPPEGNAVAAHLTGMHSAIKMLNSRIRVLHHHLVSIQKGMRLTLCHHMHSSTQVLYDIMPWACGLLEIHFLVPFISRQLSSRTDYEDCLYRRSSIWPFTSTASFQPNSQTTCNWFFKISGWFSHGMYSFEVGWALVALSKFPEEKKTYPSGPIFVIAEVLKVSILQLYSAFNYSTGLFDW